MQSDNLLGLRKKQVANADAAFPWVKIKYLLFFTKYT